MKYKLFRKYITLKTQLSIIKNTLFKEPKFKMWINIDDHVPKMLIEDLLEGHSEYRVKYQDGSEGVSKVYNNHLWYGMAITEGITHWLNK